jgi:hypothetical protein
MTRPNLWIIYKVDAGYIITTDTPKVFRTTHAKSEVIITGKSHDYLMEYAAKNNLSPITLLGKAPTSPDKPRKRKKYVKRSTKPHGNIGWRTEEEKEAIRRGTKGKVNLGSDNANYGKPRASIDRNKIKRGKKLQFIREGLKRRWCVDPEGNEHFVPGAFPLPEGWWYGRVRGRKRNYGKRNRSGRKKVATTPIINVDEYNEFSEQYA